MQPQPVLEPLSVSVRDAGKIIGLGKTKTFELIAAGSLESFKVGRKTLVRMSSIRRLVGEEAPAQ